MSVSLPRVLLALGILGAAGAARADSPAPVKIMLKDHRFTPEVIHLPPGQPAILEVTNADTTADEFEMRQLALEKVIAPGTTGRVRLRPMAPGRYQFVGEYNEATAHGTIIVDVAAAASQ
jgi:heme/copper-type cytochrome/quinol oxidase subunit 2